MTIVEPNLPWLLEGDPEGEALLAWWRRETNVYGTRREGRTRSIPNRELSAVVIPSVTHFMSYQAPDAFNETVLDFLSRH